MPRVPIEERQLDALFKHVRQLVDKRRKKRPMTYASTHECLGVVAEEFHELEEAVRTNDEGEFRDELEDLAVVTLLSLASVAAGELDW